MVGYGDRLPRRTTRGALVTLAVVSIVTAVLFHTSVLAYLSVYEVSNTDVDVADARLTDDGEAIVAHLEVTSPSSRPVTVSGAQVFVRVNDTLVTDVGATEVTETTLAPGETTTVRVRLPVIEGRRDALSAWTSGEAPLSFSGELQIVVRDRTTRVRFEGGV